MPVSRHPSRPARLAAAIALACCIQAALAQPVAFQLPEQPLEQALPAFARQAGLQLAAAPELLRGLRGQAVNATLEPAAALQLLLRGSGLQGRIANGLLTIERTIERSAERTSAAPAAAREAVMPTVRAVAAAEAGSEGGRFARRGAPAPVEPGLVSAAALARYGADDLEDTFASQPEVVVGGGHAIAQKIYLRGIEDQLLAVSIDGAAQAGQAFHHTGRVQIEPELIKRVEVLAGTGDATAGPGALGGSLRFTTKDPQDLLRPGERAGALLKGGYSSNGEGHKGHATVFTRLGADWAALLSYTHQDQDDYEDGAGRPAAATGARQQLAMAKLVGYLGDGHVLRLGFDGNRDEGERSQRPQWVPSSFNRAYPLQAERRGWTLGWDWHPGGARRDWLDLRLALHDTRQDLTQDVIGRWGLFTGQVESSGGDLRNTTQLGAHRFTYGLDHRRDRIRSGYGTSPGDYRESGRISGLYLQDRFTLSPALQLDAGLRHDRYELTDVHGRVQRADGSSPNASLRWALTPELALVAGHARALRGPKVRDAFKQDVLAANAAGLRPERARTSEAGFEFAPGAWRFNAKAYATEVRDAVADPIGRPNQYENVGTLKSRGVLLHAAWEGRTLRAGAGLHHNKATLEGQRLNGYEHNGLGTSQGDTLTASVDWRAAERLELGWTGRLVKGIAALQTGVGTVRKPGYGVHDAYVNWRLTGKAHGNAPGNAAASGGPGATLSLTVKNLFNKDYLDHGSNEDFQHIPDYEGIVGTREPGRELRLSLSLRF